MGRSFVSLKPKLRIAFAEGSTGSRGAHDLNGQFVDTALIFGGEVGHPIGFIRGPLRFRGGCGSRFGVGRCRRHGRRCLGLSASRRERGPVGHHAQVLEMRRGAAFRVVRLRNKATAWSSQPPHVRHACGCLAATEVRESSGNRQSKGTPRAKSRFEKRRG